jgi:hypothetical protein
MGILKILYTRGSKKGPEEVMSARVVEPQVSYGVRPGSPKEDRGDLIETPAREMSIGLDDLPARWVERPLQEPSRPRIGQLDYAGSKFALREGDRYKGLVSFETVVYEDRRTATDVLVGTLSRIPFLKMSKLDLGDAGAMVEMAGKPGQVMKAIAFVERNVYALILLSCEPDNSVTDIWLIRMARIMAARMR